MLRLERRSLQLDDHVTLEPRVIEEQVDEELVAGHLDAMLAPDEREA